MSKLFVLFVCLATAAGAQTINPNQIRPCAVNGNVLVTISGATTCGDSQLPALGLTIAGQVYSGQTTIQAAVNAAQGEDFSVQVPASVSPGEMNYPGISISNSASASSYFNYVAPIVNDLRPFNHDASVAQSLILPSIDGINEGGDMSAFAKCVQAGACKVAIVGNSIHECNSAVAPDEGYCNPLFAAFQRKWPGVTFTFENLAIGGTGVENFNDTSYTCETSGSNNFYRAPLGSFYTSDPIYLVGGPYYQWPAGCTTGESWQAEVSAFDPNVVILGFVENENASTQGEFIGALLTAMNTIHGFNGASPATIILTTDEPPNPNWCSLACPVPGQFEGLNEGVRGLALQTGTLLADADRYYNVLVNGIDPGRRHFQLESGLPTFPANWVAQAPFTGTMPTSANTGATDATLTFASGTVAMVHENRTAVDFTANATFESLSGAAVPSIWYRLDNAGNGTGYKVQASPTGTAGTWTLTLYFSFSTSGEQLNLAQANCVGTAGAPLNLTVKVVGSKHSVYCNSSTTPTLSTFDSNINNGGQFAIGIQTGTGVVTNQYTYFGNPSQDFTPLLSIQAMLGTQVPPTYNGQGDFNTNIYSRGGDGLHHPSMLGMDAYYLASFKPVMDQLSMTLPQHSVQILHTGFSGPYGGLQDSTDGQVDFVSGPNGGRVTNISDTTIFETWDNTTTNPHIFLRPVQATSFNQTTSVTGSCTVPTGYVSLIINGTTYHLATCP